MSEHPDEAWLTKFDRESIDAFDCQHAKQYLVEITVVADPHARVQCARCGRVFEITDEGGSDD